LNRWSPSRLGRKDDYRLARLDRLLDFPPPMFKRLIKALLSQDIESIEVINLRLEENDVPIEKGYLRPKALAICIRRG